MDQYPIPGLTDGPLSAGIISAVVGATISVLLELFPPLTAWWTAQDNASKIAYRGWLGLIVTAILTALRFTGWLPELLGGSEVTPAALVGVVATWFMFVLSAEATYHVNKSALPRKNGV